jgi:hypothetical protein
MVGHADCAGKKDFRPIVAVTVALLYALLRGDSVELPGGMVAGHT